MTEEEENRQMHTSKFLLSVFLGASLVIMAAVPFIILIAYLIKLF